MRQNYSNSLIDTQKSSLPFLDTLAQLATEPNTNGFQRSFVKRARSKYMTDNLVLQLADVPNTVLKKSYWNTYHCNSIIEQKGKELKTRYCKNRWCLTCNRVRTGILINGYLPALKKLIDPYFVTLTIKTVPKEQLQETIGLMKSVFNKTKKQLSIRKGIKLIGIRKFEDTYNAITDKYHPHYHLIIEGKENAEQLLAGWIKRLKEIDVNCIDKKGQNIRKADEKSIFELFKYFTKIISGKGDDMSIEPVALDVIFTSMINQRVFQPLGIKKVDDDVLFEQIRAEIYSDLTEQNTVYQWLNNDWVDVYTGELLTGYQPTDKVKRLFKPHKKQSKYN